MPHFRQSVEHRSTTRTNKSNMPNKHAANLAQVSFASPRGNGRRKGHPSYGLSSHMFTHKVDAFCVTVREARVCVRTHPTITFRFHGRSTLNVNISESTSTQPTTTEQKTSHRHNHVPNYIYIYMCVCCIRRATSVLAGCSCVGIILW